MVGRSERGDHGVESASALRRGVGFDALAVRAGTGGGGGRAALLQLVNPLMWIGLGLFFVTGWLIGWVVERLLRGTTGRFRTLLLGATILARSPGASCGGCSALRVSYSMA